MSPQTHDGQSDGHVALVSPQPGSQSWLPHAHATAQSAGFAEHDLAEVERVARAQLAPADVDPGEVGVVQVEGAFSAGEVVEIRDGSGRVRGRGLVNYDAAACRALVGRHSEDIEEVLGWRGYDAVVTRDNLLMGS